MFFKAAPLGYAKTEAFSLSSLTNWSAPDCIQQRGCCLTSRWRSQPPWSAWACSFRCSLNVLCLICHESKLLHSFLSAELILSLQRAGQIPLFLKKSQGAGGRESGLTPGHNLHAFPMQPTTSTGPKSLLGIFKSSPYIPIVIPHRCWEQARRQLLSKQARVQFARLL